ncbi:hypothetical protein EDF36_2473 [Rathayibacter sp. PhB152]|uniref:hypothetical protein n=1 Tax=Rathayibacter sp. PhB152 TaxID=2485190 RepID=UPI000FB0413C|nr:hypothetical protein [Rathayibacter sp. PhB152]ROQ59016.1 hypothetical protein EDF36_2473 [Rathayibacter sp. PhB152]
MDGDDRSHLDTLFTDRVDESVAFARSVQALRRGLLEATPPTIERRNVLAFFGVGGAGKTTLSKRLQHWVKSGLPAEAEWGSSPPTEVDATARVDLHDSFGRIDVARVAARLRLAYAETDVGGWHAFDIAFARWWALAHPGEPLPRMSGATGFGAAIAETLSNVAGDTVDLHEVVMAGTMTGVATRGFAWIAKQAIHSFRMTQASGVGDFSAIIDEIEEISADDPRPSLVVRIIGLLTERLIQLEPERRPLVAVFVDAFEKLADDPMRSGEGRLNDIVFAMPFTLFVFTGREHIDWAERTSVMRHRGRRTWPGLVLRRLDEPEVDVEPRQHAFGDLGPGDRRRFLKAAREEYGLAVSNEVLEAVADASGGHAQYLRLAIDVALDLTRDEEPITADAMTGGTDALAIRVLSNLPADEQRAIRTACLLPSIDTKFVAAIAEMDEGPVLRAMRRSLVAPDPAGGIDEKGAPRRHRIHDAIRAAIRNQSLAAPGAWSPGDWSAAYDRAFIEAKRRWELASDTRIPSAVLEPAGIGIRLVCESGRWAPWIRAAIVKAPSIGALLPYIPATSRFSIGQALIDYIISKSYEFALDYRIDLLDSLQGVEHPINDIFRRHRAYRLRDSGNYDEALAILDQLAARSNATERIRNVDRFQAANTLVMARRFIDATARIDNLTEDRRTGLRAVHELPRGILDLYVSVRTRRVEELTISGNYREMLEQASTLMLNSVLAGVVPLEKEVLEAVERAKLVGHQVAQKNHLAVLAYLHAGDQAATEAVCAELNRLDHGSVIDPINPRGTFPLVIDAYVRSDRERARELADRIDSKPTARGVGWIKVEAVLEALGTPLLETPTQWPEPWSKIRDRWIGHVDLFWQQLQLQRATY